MTELDAIKTLHSLTALINVAKVTLYDYVQFTSLKGAITNIT
jgi:hypothetical protein